MSAKAKLDNNKRSPPLFKEREIWWCYIGENIGEEISGKNSGFERPVLVLRKLNMFTFIGLPLTRTLKTGSWYEHVKVGKHENVIIISQPRHLDYRRMDKFIGILTTNEFKRIKDSFVRLFTQ